MNDYPAPLPFGTRKTIRWQFQYSRLRTILLHSIFGCIDALSGDVWCFPFGEIVYVINSGSVIQSKYIATSIRFTLKHIRTYYQIVLCLVFILEGT